ncbi:Smr/MutS family protein [Pseudoroseicyclus tamaricis]|uniref:DNA mismatch repair protein MutS n=1 Tax=Pseudoroseicyclus tamaricis TaxID=2705421 RepID=A0A6B2JWB0_9RHOB|nr:Smr/MutS family protein [Pseudoroseicyclus tamaricis]NDV02787.1 DNA mismatch repair protein MutS [Pseudoroseicyclus tamaricis]
MRRPRHLSPEERRLWDNVTRQADPLHPRAKTAPREPAPVEKPEPRKPEPPRKEEARLHGFRLGQKAQPKPVQDDLAPTMAEALRARPPAMDHKAHRRMTRGKLTPDARIDLHGMTAAEAHPYLTSFLLSAYGDGKRLVLVITGKGKRRDELAPMPVRQGVLRHNVPHWLALPPLRTIVMQVTPAHIRHGGEGAYYVYLRRHR